MWLVEGVTVNLTLEMSLTRSIAHGIWFGCQPPQTEDLLAEAVACARRADSVVMVIGETADAGLESIDRHTTALPEHQVALINAVCAANPRTVVVLNVAHPVDTRCLARAAAVMVVWYPGQEFGPALASVLAGDREPGGRLPVTFAREEADYAVVNLTPDHHGNLIYHEGQRVGYRYFAARECAPAWAFGYGLGYANIVFGDTRLHQADGQPLSVAVSLRNTAVRDGKVVVQVYLRPPAGHEDAPLLMLADFATASVGAGKTITVNVPLDARLFRRWNLSNQAWETQPGRWEVLTGSASNAITASHSVSVAKNGAIQLD